MPSGFRAPFPLGLARPPAASGSAGFRSPLFLVGLSGVGAAPSGVAGFRSLLAFWAGGAGGFEVLGPTPPGGGPYIPTFRRRRR
jgi:hypothetical protein